MVNKLVPGEAVAKLMRENKTTIPFLAKKMKVTQKRVRYFRDYGLSMKHTALHWFEGITGSTNGFDSWLTSFKESRFED